MATAYGADIFCIPGAPCIGYADWVGLALNLDRAETRQSGRVTSGVVRVVSGKLPLEVFRAYADTEEEAMAEYARAEDLAEQMSQAPAGEG